MLHMIIYYLIAVTFPSQTTFQTHRQYDKSVITKIQNQPISIGEVVVTGKRPTVSARIAIKNSTISNTGIKSSDLLSEITPILNVEDTSRGDRYIFLSGYDYKEIQLYLDGVPFYIPYSGDIGADIVKLVNIEKIIIEPILPSLFYGPNAMGGAINILSKSPREGIHGKADLEYSAFNAKYGTFYISGNKQGKYGSISLYGWDSPGFPLSNKFKPSLNENGGTRENSYTNGYTLFGTAGYELNDQDFVTLRYYRTSMAKGVPPEVGSNRPRYWRFTDWEKNLLNLVGRKSLGDHYYIRFNSAYIGYYNVLDSYDNSSYSTQTKKYAFHSTYNDYSLWNSLIGGYTSNLFNLDSILIYKKDIHKSQSDYDKPWKEEGEETYSAGIRAQIQKHPFIILGEGRYDYLAAFSHPNTNAINYRFAAKYLLQKGEISAIFGSTTRFPTMKERYSYRRGRSIPNPNLKPEQQNSILISAKGKIDSTHIYGYIFYSKLSNLIESVYVKKDILQNKNIKKARLEGFYLEGMAKLDPFTLSIAIQGLWAKNLSDNSILPYRPRWKFNILGKYVWEKITLGMGVNAQYLTYYQDNYTLAIEKLPGWYTIMSFVEYSPITHLTIYARATNLLDRNYETDKGFPAPGREIFVGVQGEF